MDWNDLRYVLAVSRTGTLGGAAEQLDVAYTTVGRRLRALEAEVGVRLFDRTPEGFVATEAGRDLAVVAAQVEGDVLAASGRLQGHDTRLQGTLVVSTTDMFFCGFSEVFSGFIERYPEVELTVTTTLDTVSLTRREADVVLRLTNEPPEYLVGRRVGRASFAVYAADALVEQVGPSAALGDYPWLGFAEGPEARWAAGWLDEHAPGARVVCRLDDNARSRSRAIEVGIGVFFLPCFEGDALSGVRRISEPLPEFAHDVWLLTLRDLRSTRRVRAFLDHAAGVFEQQGPRLGGGSI